MSNHESVTKIIATVNGERREFPPGVTIARLLEELGLKPDRVAVEFDRHIIRPSAWPHTEIHHGSEVEIVHFVGGG